MFFHCHSNGDENPAPPPQKDLYGYPPEVSGSVHRKIFPRGVSNPSQLKDVLDACEIDLAPELFGGWVSAGGDR